MANTYTLLETITVGAAGASSVTFNSIPQTGYTDLVIKASVRSSNYPNPFSYAYLYFNGSTTGYTTRNLRGTGSAADSGVSSPAYEIDYVNGSTATANTFSSHEWYIPNYTSANYKSYSQDNVMETNATTAYMGLAASLWSNTAAISSVTITNAGYVFGQYTSFSLYGVSALGVTPTKAPKATGGSIIQTDGTYWYHAFLSSGTFTPATALSCDVLVVAGGGGSGLSYGAGGGGGGVFYATSQSLSSAQTVTVGAGGAAARNSAETGFAGSNSVFGSLTNAIGGGGGASQSAKNGANGGSGGGGSIASGTGGSTTQTGTGGTGYGFAGGAGNASTAAGGGGGAGSVGLAPVSNTGGAGGAGTSAFSNWGSVTGTGINVSGTYYYAGGGSGNGTGGAAAPGAGGTAVSTSGVANTGAGAGGDGSAIGGSGIVIVRYLAA